MNIERRTTPKIIFQNYSKDTSYIHVEFEATNVAKFCRTSVSGSNLLIGTGLKSPAVVRIFRTHVEAPLLVNLNIVTVVH